MKNNGQTLLLVIILTMILIPTGIAVNRYIVDYYKGLESEAVVAYEAAEMLEPKVEVEPVTPTPPVPGPPQTTCSECNGTKRVRTGDGLSTMPCTCGEACQCKKMRSEPLPAPVEPVVQLLYFTQPKCLPCSQMMDTTLRTLKKRGWEFGKGKHIEIIDITLDKASFERYNPLAMPTTIRLVDGIETIRYVGYVNSRAMKKVWEGQLLTREIDDVYMDYKE